MIQTSDAINLRPALTSHSSTTIIQQPSISLSLAQSALSASIAQAAKLGVPVNVSIYSPSLHLLAFARMDGAKLTSIDIAHNKAFTAAGHKAGTDTYKDRVEPGGGLWGVQHSNGGRFCTIMGGEPISWAKGEVLGSIGVSGGTPQQDKEIALAGVSKVYEVLKQDKQSEKAAKAKL